MCCTSAQCRCPHRRAAASSSWWSIGSRFDSCAATPQFMSIAGPSSWESMLKPCRCAQQPGAGAPQQAFVLYRDELAGNISKVSVGETSGLFPTDSGAASKLYNPGEWDKDLTKQLLECRAAVTLLATRGERHHAVPAKTGTALERRLAAYHLKDNFPPVSPEIQSDPTVRYFYLSPDSKAVHKGLDYKTWDIRLVKSYGPFFNVGGGDVPRGLTYVNFYSGRRKTSGK